MDDRLVRWLCAYRGPLPSTDIRQLPGNCAKAGSPFFGSIPLPAAETVFRTLAAATGPHLKRLPDGETGIRKTSIRFLQ